MKRMERQFVRSVGVSYERKVNNELRFPIEALLPESSLRTDQLMSGMKY